MPPPRCHSRTSAVSPWLRAGGTLAGLLPLVVLILETGRVSERLRVREIDDDEGRRLVRIVRRGSGSVVTWRRGADGVAVRAGHGRGPRSRRSQSGRLADLGRREDALAAIEEAVTAYRQLAYARPDAFLPDLAMSLNNQSLRLADLGRREQALVAIKEAVTIRRQLARARPQVHSERLAASLNNLAAQLEAADQKSAADTARAEAARLE